MSLARRKPKKKPFFIVLKDTFLYRAQKYVPLARRKPFFIVVKDTFLYCLHRCVSSSRRKTFRYCVQKHVSLFCERMCFIIYINALKGMFLCCAKNTRVFIVFEDTFLFCVNRYLSLAKQKPQYFSLFCSNIRVFGYVRLFYKRAL